MTSGSARRLTRGAGALLVVVLAVAGANEAHTRWQATRTRTLPAPTGPYAVGRRSLAVRDDSRFDGLSPNPFARREVFLWIWYPAARGAGQKVAPYLPADWLKVIPRGSFGQRLDRVRSHATDAAPVSDSQPSYPVLVFSPGLGVMPTNYTTLAAEVASHGYIVVAVAHPFSTPVVVFPDGRVVRSSQSPYDLGYSSLVMVLAQDLVSVLKRILHEHDSGDPFFSRIDPQRIGVFGHSFGGASSAVACRLDGRFKAGMDLDGTVFGPVVETGVRQPFFLLTGGLHWTAMLRRDAPQFFPDHDQGQIHEEMFFARSPRAYWLSVRRLNHMNFADEGFFFGPKDRAAELVGVRIDAHRTQTIASAYIRAFFGRHLSGVESAGRELEPSTNPDLSLAVHTAH